jgi:ORF6N domain
MPKSSNKLTTDQLGRLIYEIRSERVMLDSDLASIYGVETKGLNRAVKRNRDRFPKDFVFQLTEKEWKNLRYQIGTASSSREHQSLRYQIGTSSSGHGGRRNRPYVFTEHGAIMAANVLNSRRAVQMNTTCGDAVGWTALSVWETDERSGRARVNVFVVSAFLKMRALLGDKRDLAQKLASLEKELKKRLDVHEAVIVTILQRVMDIIDPPLAPEPPNRVLVLHHNRSRITGHGSGYAAVLAFYQTPNI